MHGPPKRFIAILIATALLVACSDDSGDDSGTADLPRDAAPAELGADLGGDADVDDSGADTAADSGADTAADSGGDSAADSGGDSAADSGGDSAADSGGDTAADSGAETAVDSGAETAVDSGAETAVDSALDLAPDLPPPACDDGIKNGDEGDIDCGGSCPDRCAPGQHCNQPTDCALGSCSGGVCPYPDSCAELIELAPSTPDGTYEIQPAGATQPLEVYCDMTTAGGGWTQLLSCLPVDGCTVDSNQLYQLPWRGVDHGTTGGAVSFLLGQSLAPLVDTDGYFMVEIEDTSQQPPLVGRLVYPLDSATRGFFDGAATYHSTALEVALIDSDATVRREQLKICRATSWPYARSYQGRTGLAFLGHTSGTPDADATSGCDFGAWDGQILVRQSALSTMMWGQTPSAGWASQPFAHRVFVRRPVAKTVTIVAHGNGRRWSDGSYARSCYGYRRPLAFGPRSYDGATGDGIYTVKPEPAGAAFDVFCEMSTDGGGWTLVQRTVWDWSATQALYSGYNVFHDSTVGDLASAWRAAGRLWLLWYEQRELLVSYTARKSNGESCEPLRHKGQGGTLAADPANHSFTLSGLSAQVNLIDNTALSTTDSGPSANCPQSYDAVPWFYASCCTSCPSFKGSYWADSAHPMVRATVLTGTDDILGHRLADVCGGASVTNSLNYTGLNRMEVFLR